MLKKWSVCLCMFVCVSLRMCECIACNCTSCCPLIMVHLLFQLETNPFVPIGPFQIGCPQMCVLIGRLAEGTDLQLQLSERSFKQSGHSVASH